MKKLVLLLGFLGAGSVQAMEGLERAELEPAVMSGFISWHNTSKYEPPPKGYNANNIGIGYRHPSGWAAGYYRNSFRRDSFYVAREWQWHVTDNLRVGVIGALVTGYETLRVMPAVLPEIVYKAGASEFVILASPAVNSDSPGLVSFQYRLALK